MKRQSQAVIPSFSETEMAQFQIRFEEYFLSRAVEILTSPCTSVETTFHQTKVISMGFNKFRKSSNHWS